MSQRDKGNQHFRVGEYEQAVSCYERYIQQDPLAQRRAAYCNISFSYYKMGRFRESVQAADDAIVEDQQYTKAYYRKMQAFKEMLGCDYEVYINAVLFLKYYKETDEKNRYDTSIIAKEYKSRWMKSLGRDSYKIGKDNCLLDMLDESGQNESNGMEKEKKRHWFVEKWLDWWFAKDISSEQKWAQIEKIALLENGEYGLNIAYLILNNLKQPQRAFIGQKIKKLVAALSTKMQVQSINNQEMLSEEQVPSKQQKKSSSQDQNLFQSSQISPQIQRQTKNNNIQQKYNKIQTTTKPLTLQQISASTITSPRHLSSHTKQAFNQSLTNQVKPLKQQIKSSMDQINILNNNTTPLKDQVIKRQEIKTQQETQNLSMQQIEKIYKQYTYSLSTSRDVMQDLLKAAESVLASGHSVSVKRNLLDLFKVRHPKQLSWMRKSFTKPQQQRVRDLLVENGLQCYMTDFAYKHALQH